MPFRSASTDYGGLGLEVSKITRHHAVGLIVAMTPTVYPRQPQIAAPRPIGTAIQSAFIAHANIENEGSHI